MNAAEEKEIYRAAISIYTAALAHDQYYSPQDRVVLRYRAAEEALAMHEHMQCVLRSEEPAMYGYGVKEKALRTAISKVGMSPSAIGHELHISRRAARAWLRRFVPEYEPAYRPG